MSSLKVFISSHMKELHNERAAVGLALEICGFEVLMFEKFPASTRGPKQSFAEEVDECDVYVGLFWNTYSEATEEEYRRARQAGKECLIYLKDEYVKREDRLQRFIDEIGNYHVWRRFRNVIDLAKQVVSDLVIWMSRALRRSQTELASHYRANAVENYLNSKGRLGADGVVQLQEMLLQWKDGFPGGMFDYLADQRDMIQQYSEVRHRLIGDKIAHVDVVSGKCLTSRDVTLQLISSTYRVSGASGVAIRTDQEELIGQLIEMFAGAESEDRLNVRLLDCEIQNSGIVLTVQPTSYRGYMVTNYAAFLERHIRNFPSLFMSGKGNRESVEPPPGLSPLDRAFAANHVGLNCVLVTVDNWLILHRKQRQSVTFPDAINLTPSSVWRWEGEQTDAFAAMWYQLEQNETRIPRERAMHDLVCIGITRELLRAGKPEMFFYLCVDMSLAEIYRAMKGATRESSVDPDLQQVRLPRAGTASDTLRFIEQAVFERRDYAPSVQGGMWLLKKAIENDELVPKSGNWIPKALA